MASNGDGKEMSLSYIEINIQKYNSLYLPTTYML